MKQFNFLFLLVFGALISAQAQSNMVNGTVTANGLAVPNHIVSVIVVDSNIINPYFQSFTLPTNLNGYYSTPVMIGVPNNASVTVMTTDTCGGNSQTKYGNIVLGAVTTLNFALPNCGSNPPPPPPVPYVSGQISKGISTNPAMMNEAKVYLIRKDSTALGLSLTAVDSTMTDSMGFYYFNASNITTLSKYLVKAALMPASASYNSYIPTYYTNALMWSSGVAPSINSANNIVLIAGSNVGGSGFVGGLVSQGANKVGDPLAGKIMILKKSDGTAMRYTYTNAQGRYNFTNLPYGTYILHGDAMGKTNIPYTFTISVLTNLTNVNFEENDYQFKRVAPQGISVANSSKEFTISPNPTKDMVNIKVNDSKIEVNQITVVDYLGRKVFSKATTQSSSEHQIALNHLTAGVYYIILATKANSSYTYTISLQK